VVVSDFVKPVDQSSRFLIVTEGSSDAAIIGKAFRLLSPHIADFFDFVDMEEGYPFSGTGNVFRASPFCNSSLPRKARL
jgi:hypothetical protein